MVPNCCATPALAGDVAAAVQAEDGGAGERQKLQGTWFAVLAYRNGQDADYFNGNRLSFDGDRFAIRNDDGDLLFQGTYRVNPAAEPAQIDFQHEGNKLEGSNWQGIYMLTGNTLRICDNAPNPQADRPRQFSAGLGSGCLYFVFRRR